MSEQGSSEAPHRRVAEADRLFEMLEPAVNARNLHLEEVHMHQAGSHRTLQVIVDLPEGDAGSLSLDAIADLSQALSMVMDQDPDGDERPYNLEVSSPGVARPLTQPRHWRRAVGRMVTIKFPKAAHHHEDVAGRLIRFQEPVAVIRPETVVKKGMKPRLGEPIEVDITTIKRAIVDVEFSRLGPDETESAQDPVSSGVAEEAPSERRSGRKRAERGQKGRGRNGH